MQLRSPQIRSPLPDKPSRTRKRSLSTATTASSPGSRLACKRCRNRKIKCDSAFPRCTSCSKADLACVVADYSTSREYTRSEVQDLESRYRQLETLLKDSEQPDVSIGARSQRTVAPSEASQDTTLATSPTRYVGREAGVDFFQPMLEALRKQSPAARNAAPPSQSHTASIVYHGPHRLPIKHEALGIATSYLRDFHVAHPFLDAGRIGALFNRLYREDDVQRNSFSSVTKSEQQHDLFQANMILAIGSIAGFRAGKTTYHPFGFFTAALDASSPSRFSFGRIQDIENLLLIAHFGVSYNIGCSIWELSRLCMRICIELQLHKKDPIESRWTNEEGQRRKMVFWETYFLDRFSSSTLGRPFAIDDSIITVSLAEPLPTTHDNLGPNDSPRSIYGWPRDAEANDRTVFNHLLALSRITSSLHSSQQSQRWRGRGQDSPSKGRAPGPGSEDSFEILHKLRGHLDAWYSQTPRYDNPTCLYQSSDYFELCFQKEKLYLIRVAIDQSPSKSSLPPVYLLKPCLSTAHKVIQSFNRLRSKGLVTYTRSYMHLIFTTSLIIVFLSFAQVHPQYEKQNAEAHHSSFVDVESWWAELLDDGSRPTQDESLEVLSLAGQILSWLSNNMTDMRPYARFMEALKHELIKEIEKASDHSTSVRGWGRPNSQTTTTTGDRVLGSEHDQDQLGGEYQGLLPNVLPSHTRSGSDDPNVLGIDVPVGMQDMDSEGILFNFFPMEDMLHDVGGLQPMNTSWPFSQIPWIDSITSDLSGYDGDFNLP